MGAFPAAIVTTRAETKERKRERREARTIAASEKEEEEETKRKRAEAGRTALIQTTPRGVLNPQTSGRKRLTS